LISFDESYRLVLSTKIKTQAKNEIVKSYFLDLEGKTLEMPYRFLPDIDALKEHREICMNN